MCTIFYQRSWELLHLLRANQLIQGTQGLSHLLNLSGWNCNCNLSRRISASTDTELNLWWLFDLFYPVFPSTCLLPPYIFQYTGSLNHAADYPSHKYTIFLLSRYLSHAQAYWLCQIIHHPYNSAFCTCSLHFLDNGLLTFQHCICFPSIHFPGVGCQ